MLIFLYVLTACVFIYTCAWFRDMETKIEILKDEEFKDKQTINHLLKEVDDLKSRVDDPEIKNNKKPMRHIKK